MIQSRISRTACRLSDNGLTLMELMITVAIVAAISAIAVPASHQWIHNAEYRATARSIVNVLREARSRAIAGNLEHKVEFETLNRRYRVIRGNRASNSADWSTVVCDWTAFPEGVHVTSNVGAIHINTNGTANGGTISIQDNEMRIRFEVRVARTGRIRIPIL
jgi:prepilin-type N-terminal cleavage/methylation domain-containing protein